MVINIVSNHSFNFSVDLKIVEIKTWGRGRMPAGRPRAEVSGVSL